MPCVLQIGFSERSGYTAIGTVCNVAARLCAETKDGQILLGQRVNVALKGSVATEQVAHSSLRASASRSWPTTYRSRPANQLSVLSKAAHESLSLTLRTRVGFGAGRAVQNAKLSDREGQVLTLVRRRAA